MKAVFPLVRQPAFRPFSLGKHPRWRTGIPLNWVIQGSAGSRRRSGAAGARGCQMSGGKQVDPRKRRRELPHPATASQAGRRRPPEQQGLLPSGGRIPLWDWRVRPAVHDPYHPVLVALSLVAPQVLSSQSPPQRQGPGTPGKHAAPRSVQACLRPRPGQQAQKPAMGPPAQPSTQQGHGLQGRAASGRDFDRPWPMPERHAPETLCTYQSIQNRQTMANPAPERLPATASTG